MQSAATWAQVCLLGIKSWAPLCFLLAPRSLRRTPQRGFFVWHTVFFCFGFFLMVHCLFSMLKTRLVVFRGIFSLLPLHHSHPEELPNLILGLRRTTAEMLTGLESSSIVSSWWQNRPGTVHTMTRHTKAQNLVPCKTHRETRIV